MRLRIHLLCLSLLFPLVSHAGPLRDWLQHRQQQQQPSEMDTSDDDSAINFTGKKLTNVAYGTDKQQQLDVYLPNQAHNAPIIVMVHGGGWKHGDKAYRRVVEHKVGRWQTKGFIFISLNYRLLPDANPLQQAQDVALALSYIQQHASSWGGDSQQMIVMGHSAGAHLVSLVTVNASLRQQAAPWLGTVSLDSAAYNVVELMQRKHYRLYDPAFGSDFAFWQATSPYHQLQKTPIPLLAVCSTTRPDQPCQQAQAFMDKAKALGNRVELLPEPLSHGDINQQLGEPMAYTELVEQFMASLSPVVKSYLTH